MAQVTEVLNNVLSVSAQLNAKNSVTVLDRQSIVGIAAASDAHKTLSINVNSWTAVGSEFEVSLVHGLGKKASITVVDSFNQTQYPDVIYTDNNTVKLIVRAQFSGQVHFN
tara:strand:+ start:117 stop:449 length:333 start_codon:yes stop_codon:yes gene_type:complete